MALDKLVDSTQLDNNLTSVANAIRAKSGGTEQLAFPAGFVSEIGKISGGGGITPTGTKEITITENGTTTEDVTNYSSAQITVNVPSSGGNGLPTEYQAVEYIDTNDSGAYIETNFEPKIGDDIFAIFALNELPTNQDGVLSLFSAGQGSQQLICMYGFNTGLNPVKTYSKYFGTGSATEQTHQVNANTFFPIAFSRLNESTARILVGGSSEQATIVGELDGTSKNLFIAMRANNTAPLNGKISKFLVLNNGILRCNLVPCYRKSDDVIGMYDTVSRVFYTNAGTGNFLKGGEL